MAQPNSDFFFEAYDREDIAYGLEPSSAVAAFLQQFSRGGKALDLGAGAGRDTLALAKGGFDVLSVDISERGLERISERANQRGLGEKVVTQVCDVRKFDFVPKTYDAIVATTVLDHIPSQDAKPVWDRMITALHPQGMLFVEVHTTSDPGSPIPPGSQSEHPVSETAGAVINYFRPNELISWAVDPQSHLRVLRYEERQEWDYTHGPEHMHGKAILLAVHEGFHPDWYGQPPAFPRKK